MRIAVGSDHAGYEDPPPWYKPAIMEHLKSRGHEVIDCGTNGPESVDYPDFAGKVCQSILSGEAERGVLMCGTGIGVGIAANRYKGIRAATCATPDMARLSREHNNANVICLGRRILSLDKCIQLIDIWLDTPFSGGERHTRRVEKMG
ncbi:MAG: ribose 5-phosphate isomerase B [Candidatus Hydrogenedentes bacterium]|nr:ribose 5-phosphate isomerase B [Candidatus Hydrogenedentota bacterium]